MIAWIYTKIILHYYKHIFYNHLNVNNIVCRFKNNRKGSERKRESDNLCKENTQHTADNIRKILWTTTSPPYQNRPRRASEPIYTTSKKKPLALEIDYAASSCMPAPWMMHVWPGRVNNELLRAPQADVHPAVRAALSRPPRRWDSRPATVLYTYSSNSALNQSSRDFSAVRRLDNVQPTDIEEPTGSPAYIVLWGDLFWLVILVSVTLSIYRSHCFFFMNWI